MRSLLLAAALLAGCGSSVAKERLPTYSPGLAHVPACAHAGPPIGLPIRAPQRFPPHFPFPDGTDLVRTAPLLHGVHGVGVYGYIPSASFARTVHFFPRELPKAGFRVLAVEIDSPHDSEGTYQGRGYQGRWALQSIPGCKAMHIGVSAVRLHK